MENRYGLIVAAAAAAVFLGCVPAPPNLMDDVDAVQAQVARNMLESGDWVTARLDGVPYLEKSPLIYWMMAASFRVFGVADWAARLPLALGCVGLSLAAFGFARWAFGPLAGLVSGLMMATSVGMFLFTRIQIPDALVTLAMLVTLWGFLRALEGERRWAAIGAAAMGCGILLKALIAIVFPCAAMVVFLAITGEWKSRETWRRLHLPSSIAIIAAISLPWHVAATLANPPYFDFTWGSRPGEYHGFFWFYFLNEHVFRFLNIRHPRDYNTVPRLLFWLLHLVWLFPWTGALAGAFGEAFRGTDRASRTRLLALCWAGFVMVFFSFSTTQEYYSMPAYPAFALLAGSAVASGSAASRIGLRMSSAVFGLAGVAILAILAMVWGTAPQGDIAKSLTQNPSAYTLSMGHMGDLTLESFAHLKLPLLVALAASIAGLLARGRVLTLALAMVVFVHAARLALIAFDPYLGSRELAESYRKAPPGELIVDNQYYAFSSVFFYAGVDRAWLLNGRVNNLEYGSYAPGAPQVFLDHGELARRWHSAQRYYLLVEEPARMKVGALIADSLYLVKASGGKYLYTNQPWRTPSLAP